jgi:hypothetical protein
LAAAKLTIVDDILEQCALSLRTPEESSTIFMAITAAKSPKKACQRYEHGRHAESGVDQDRRSTRAPRGRRCHLRVSKHLTRISISL